MAQGVGNYQGYVSRGGLKLEKALKVFPVCVEGKICIDCGASTGGFTDCLLQNGAVKVYSIDVGRGQLDWKLRCDERVVCMERTNVRYLTAEDIPEPQSAMTITMSHSSAARPIRLFTVSEPIGYASPPTASTAAVIPFSAMSKRFCPPSAVEIPLMPY